MSGLTTTGFEAKPLETILTDIKARLRTSFGSAVDTNTDSVLMTMLLPVILELDELWQGSQGQYDALNKNNAEGVQLDNLGAITSIPRLAGSYSTVNVDVEGDEGAVISAGFIRSVDDTNEPFQTTIDWTLPASGDQPYTIEMTAMNDGPVAAYAGTLNVGSLPANVDTMTNQTASLGVDDETDEAYRIGLGTRLASLGAGTVPAIKAALLTVTGVTAVTVFENDTVVTDSDGLPPHSIRPLISGSFADQDIWDTLGVEKGAGTYTDGTEVGTYTDPTDGQEFTMRFSTPSPVRMYVSVVVTATNSYFPATGLADIKAAIIAEGATFELGDDVTLPRLQSAVTSIDGIDSYTLYFNTTATPVVDANIAITNAQIAEFGIISDTDIIVT